MNERRVALVTGGARGIGLGIARALAREGCDLGLCGRRSLDEVRGVVAELEALGAAVLYVPADVSHAQDRSALLSAIRERYDRLDILVNNAGIAPTVRADILEATEASFEQLVQTNLQGPFFLTQAVARWMIEQAAARPFVGSVVTITSVSAVVASINRGDYCITKAGLSMASRLWAVRLAEYGIPVYEVQPGIILSDMSAGQRDKYDRLIADGLLLQARWGLPEDVGRAVAMLARGDLGYSTAGTIVVDGGMTTQRI